MSSKTKPEKLLLGFGVQKPSDIDLEAIAYALGAKTRYLSMDGCEARIIGHEDNAIITVDNRFGEKRARFSLAHEIGHWQEHRGQILFCSKEDINNAKRNGSNKEREADRYAAGLLMPQYLFEPIARRFDKPSFVSIENLANEFNVSRLAAAIRFIDMDVTPSILICHGPKGRLWFKRSKSWPSRFFPMAELDHNSEAFELVYGKGSKDGSLSLCPAETYFDCSGADRYEVWSHSVFAGQVKNDGTRVVLTLVIPKSIDMID